MVSRKFPIIGEHVVIVFVTQLVTIATVLPAKTPLIKAVGAYDSNGTMKFVYIDQILINMMRRKL